MTSNYNGNASNVAGDTQVVVAVPNDSDPQVAEVYAQAYRKLSDYAQRFLAFMATAFASLSADQTFAGSNTFTRGVVAPNVAKMWFCGHGASGSMVTDKSYNISAAAISGQDVTLTFANPMPDTNYSCVIGWNVVGLCTVHNKTTTSVTIRCEAVLNGTSSTATWNYPPVSTVWNGNYLNVAVFD